MEEKDLDSFRIKWLSELETRNNYPGETSKEEAVTDESSCSSVNGIELCKNDIKNKTVGEFPAFGIANNYLSFNTNNCKYCNIPNENTSISNAKIADKHKNCLCNSSKRKNCGITHKEKGYHSSKKLKYAKISKELYLKKYFGNSPLPGEAKETEKEDLVNLLIADIDEITCIPFFDIDLPKEIAVKIFQYLSIKDLSNCCCVNSKWHILATDDLLWFNLCDVLDVDKGVAFIADRQGWNQYVKNSILERRRVQGKWKERCCQVRDLRNIEDHVLCSASVCNSHIIAAYLDGSIKLWNLNTGNCGENLKEKHSNIEDLVLSICSCIHLSRHLCVAGFENGDVMVWKRDVNMCGQLIFMDNYDSKLISFIQGSKDGRHFLVGFDSKFILVGASESSGDKWNWSRVFEKNVCDNITTLMLTTTVLSPISIINSTDLQLTVHLADRNENMILEQLTGATISCVDVKNSFVVAAIGGVGYSILDGYRIRKYCVKSGKQLANIIGSQTVIMCLNYADCYDDEVVIGCADCTIRIYDFKNESSLMKICGIESSITTIQMDKWKVVTGHQNGTICLWDRFNGTMYWQSRATKHPVHICKFDGQLLTSVTIPEDKFQAKNYYDNEIPQHRRYQDSIRVMDFTKDNYTIGVPDVCHAEYDDIAGYDYNIELIAPYDDVQSLRLPKI